MDLRGDEPAVPRVPVTGLPRRYALDTEGERTALRLRGIAGLVALAASLWLLLLPHLLPRLLAVVGCAFGVVWLARWRRGVPRSGDGFLELRDDALVRRAEGREDVVPWRAMRDVQVDEDRLVVRVERLDAEPLLIEPRYGLGLYALCDEVRLVWRSVLK
jgi:hypothetical protein